MERCNNILRCALRAIRLIVTDDCLASVLNSSTPATDETTIAVINAANRAVGALQ